MKDNDFGKNFLIIMGAIGTVFFFIFISSWINFWLAYFSGWIAKITIGKYLVSGLQLLGITIPINSIPLLAGALGWISGFFKATTHINNTNRTKE